MKNEKNFENFEKTQNLIKNNEFISFIKYVWYKDLILLTNYTQQYMIIMNAKEHVDNGLYRCVIMNHLNEELLIINTNIRISCKLFGCYVMLYYVMYVI